MVIMICGLALFASILSSLVDIVQQSSKQARKSATVRSKLTDVQHWMSQRNLGPKVRSDILRFYAEDWGQLQEEDPSILGALPWAALFRVSFGDFGAMLAKRTRVEQRGAKVGATGGSTRAEDLPTDLAAETIWAMVAQDFKNVPLWAELYGHSEADMGANVNQEDTQKVRFYLFIFPVCPPFSGAFRAPHVGGACRRWRPRCAQSRRRAARTSRSRAPTPTRSSSCSGAPSRCCTWATPWRASWRPPPLVRPRCCARRWTRPTSARVATGPPPRACARSRPNTPCCLAALLGCGWRGGRCAPP